MARGAHVSRRHRVDGLFRVGCDLAGSAFRRRRRTVGDRLDTETDGWLHGRHSAYRYGEANIEHHVLCHAVGVQQPASAYREGSRRKYGLVILAVFSVGIWAVILPITQPEQLNRRRAEDDLR